MNKTSIGACFAIIMLLGCGSDESTTEPAAVVDQSETNTETTAESSTPDHVLATQVEALDKAKSLQDQLNQQAEQQLQDIDKMTSDDG